MKIITMTIISFAAFAGCVAEPMYRTVSRADYIRTDECWFDDKGKFSAFVILSSDKNGYRPTFVSKYCRVSGVLSGAEYLVDLPPFPITGDEGLAMKKGFVDQPILDSLDNHATYFSNDARIFEIYATLLQSEGGQAYDIKEIQVLKLRDDLTFESAGHWPAQMHPDG